MGGRWRKLAKSPFAAYGAASAWTGDRLIVVKPEDGRAAAYDPEKDTWRMLPRAPHPFDATSRSVWTGGELIILDDSEGVATAQAFDAEAGRWRQLREPPFQRNPIGDRVLADAVWAGDRVVLSSLDGSVAAYLPARDCWERHPPLPRTAGWSTLHWTGSEVLADTGAGRLAILDMTTGDWEPLPPGHLGGLASGGVWADGRLWFLTAFPEDDAGRHAVWDPVSGTWRAVGNHCRIDSSAAVWTGRLLLDIDVRRAMEPRTGGCYRVPGVEDRTRRAAVEVWTGRDLIRWSGGQGEETPPLPDGVAYRPPRWATAEGLAPDAQ